MISRGYGMQESRIRSTTDAVLTQEDANTTPTADAEKYHYDPNGKLTVLTQRNGKRITHTG
jgi:hypothetical protein